MFTESDEMSCPLAMFLFGGTSQQYLIQVLLETVEGIVVELSSYTMGKFGKNQLLSL